MMLLEVLSSTMSSTWPIFCPAVFLTVVPMTFLARIAEVCPDGVVIAISFACGPGWIAMVWIAPTVPASENVSLCCKQNRLRQMSATSGLQRCPTRNALNFFQCHGGSDEYL